MNWYDPMKKAKLLTPRIVRMIAYAKGINRAPISARNPAITRSIQDLQGRAVSYQLELLEENQDLLEILRAERIDLDRAMDQAEAFLNTENRVKKAQIELLIRSTHEPSCLVTGRRRSRSSSSIRACSPQRFATRSSDWRIGGLALRPIAF